MVRLLVTLFGLVVVGIGLMTIVRPKSVESILRHLLQGRRLYLVMGGQVAMAWLFYAAATQSRSPTVMTAFALGFMASAVIMLVMGLKRFRAWVEWLLSLPVGVFIVIGLIRVMVGSWLIYMVN
jgi:hypothetical protein|tara:strand:+ start:825 stop:1196 length:372 start_codon:yes stop_codon:yes gene_type:complete